MNGAIRLIFIFPSQECKSCETLLKKLIKYNPPCDVSVINTDKNPAYGQAIRELKQEGNLASHINHLQIKYRNNRLEADHGKLKLLINPVRGFQSMKTAYATIKGFEILRMFKKGKFNIWMVGNRTEISFIMNNLEFTAEICSEIAFLHSFSFLQRSQLNQLIFLNQNFRAGRFHLSLRFNREFSSPSLTRLMSSRHKLVQRFFILHP